MSQNQTQNTTTKIAGNPNSNFKIKGDFNTFFSISPQELAKYWNITVEKLRTIKFETPYKELNEAIAKWQQTVNSRDNFLYRFFIGEPEETSIVIRSNGDYYGVPKFKIYLPVNGTPDHENKIKGEGYGPYMLDEVEVIGTKNNTATTDTTAVTTPQVNTAVSDTTAITIPQVNTAVSDTTKIATTPAHKITEQQAQQKAVDSDEEEDLVDGTPYKVKKGNTLWGIAKNKLKKNFDKVSNKQILQYVQQIMNVNNITDSKGIIHVGDVLTLPEFDDNTPAYQPPQSKSSKKKKEEGLPTVYLKEDRTGNTQYKKNIDYTTTPPDKNLYPEYYYDQFPSPTPTININISTPQDRLSTVKTDDDFMW